MAKDAVRRLAGLLSSQPVNKKIEPTQMYCEKADELIVCGGIYKPL